MNSIYVTINAFYAESKQFFKRFNNKLHFTYDSLHIKDTLILSVFSRQQSFNTILSQYRIIVTFETSE